MYNEIVNKILVYMALRVFNYCTKTLIDVEHVENTGGMVQLALFINFILFAGMAFDNNFLVMPARMQEPRGRRNIRRRNTRSVSDIILILLRISSAASALNNIYIFLKINHHINCLYALELLQNQPDFKDKLLAGGFCPTPTP